MRRSRCCLTASSGDLVDLARSAFADDTAAPPPLTLRGGSDVDSYRTPSPHDAGLDAPTDDYLEQFAFHGLPFLDAASWRHYLPPLIEYALKRPDDPHMAVEALIWSLRPPDRYPPRLGSLTPHQETVVRRFLEHLAFEPAFVESAELATQALEEWWLPNPRSRPTAEAIAAMRQQPVVFRTVRMDIWELRVPETLSGSDVRVISEESRRVAVFGGFLCGDVHTVVAINVSPLAAQAKVQAADTHKSWFRDPVSPSSVTVKGAIRAHRLDGLAVANSAADVQSLVVVVAQTSDEQLTMTIRSWERADIRDVIEQIAASLAIVST